MNRCIQFSRRSFKPIEHIILLPKESLDLETGSSNFIEHLNTEGENTEQSTKQQKFNRFLQYRQDNAFRTDKIIEYNKDSESSSICNQSKNKEAKEEGEEEKTEKSKIL